MRTTRPRAIYDPRWVNKDVHGREGQWQPESRQVGPPTVDEAAKPSVYILDADGEPVVERPRPIGFCRW